MLFLSQVARAKTGSWLFARKDNLGKIFLFLILLFLPTQLGLHFWPNYSYVYGLRIDYLSPTLYFTDVIVVIIFGIIFLRNVTRKFNYLLILFFIVLLIGDLFARNWQIGLYGIIKFLELSFLAYFFSSKIIRLNLILFPLALASLFEGLLAITQFLNKGSLGSVLYFFGERTFNGQTPGIANSSISGDLVLRPYGTFSHPNVLAAFLLIVVSLIIFGKSKLNWFYALILVVSVFALLLTLSRPAILLLLVVALLKIILLLKRKINKKKLLLSFGVLVTVILYFVFFSQYSVRFLGSSLGDISFTQRESLANASIAMFLKHPLFGVGANNFLVNLPTYLSQQKTLLLQPVHNIYLLSLSETGIVGFLLFLTAIFLALRSVFKRKIFLAGIVLFEFLFLGLFDHYFFTLQQGQLLTALIFGLSFSKSKINIE